MKKKMRMTAVGAVLAAVCLMSGCSKVTAESLLTDAGKNIGKATSMEGDVSLEMTMKVGGEGVSMDVDANADCTMQFTSEPPVGHMEGTMNLSLLNMNVDLENYYEQADGKTIVYTRVADQWSKTETELPKEDGETTKIIQFAKILAGIGKEKLVLEQETKQINEKEAYVIRAELTGEDFGELIQLMGETLGSQKEENMNLDALKTEISLYIDKGSKTLAGLEFEITDGLTQAVKGNSENDSAAEMEISQCKVSLDSLAFNTVDQITVPEEAKNAAIKEES